MHFFGACKPTHPHPQAGTCEKKHSRGGFIVFMVNLHALNLRSIMFKTNEYFEGKVKSIAFNTAEGPATIGVMAGGEYEFGTSTVEFMTVTSGSMTVKLPGETEWKTFKPFETFIVAKDQKFNLRIQSDVSYLCLYR